MRLKLLSIAIPTLNRADILKFTIENFIDQIAINSEKVELVVCSNACNDNTSDVALQERAGPDLLHGGPLGL